MNLVEIKNIKKIREKHCTTPARSIRSAKAEGRFNYGRKDKAGD